MNRRIFLVIVVAVAVLAVIVAIVASVAVARVPSSAVKARVLDKSESGKWAEVRVIEETKKKTSILGDKVIVRVLDKTAAYNKSSKKQSSKNWLGSLQNDDLISVLGEYKSTDGTVWADKVVNRSR